MTTEADLARMQAELEAIHRENRKRDEIINIMARDMKELLALANQSKGGFWMGMAIASALGGLASWALGHITLRG